MNKMTRALVMTGAAVAAGVSVAAGPAAAGPAAGPAAVRSAPVAPAGVTSVAPQKPSFQRSDRIFGFYNSPRTCHKIGRMGQWKNQWQRYSCFKVYRGFHSGEWALKVYYGWNYHHGSKGDYAPGGDNYGGYGQRKS
ncbi:hypothetical protein Q0Z83_057470 [Actinoplanes sichuanensis]|uniref:Uncharacterized protein n=1 Tax=Actinoplanes sichuanensis TaxID=512349 RepID=A0ABW4A5E8_9ACTN|nr:hypothetical protein [Actinoplanes sichuanensis]BEL07556.1 hypothetical protein Q0Z83_057470 [Actinoplanes sichuanensis]